MFNFLKTGDIMFIDKLQINGETAFEVGGLGQGKAYCNPKHYTWLETYNRIVRPKNAIRIVLLTK